ncbi:protein FAM193A-like isoform X2 [Dendronephthya gigantea]|uniref:protein FAM193A-like isoform X2 n=1 Tax=Dendronephthya gigantea TaxID=151771 RepID=UPI00106DA252|nr:protein FAM193A-like isoform X2 [Dendronephthya gigantea]
MSAASESKRSNRKAKKKRSAQQTKESQTSKVNATSKKTGPFANAGLDASIALSQVVNKSSFTPFLDGERCILCHQERPTITRKENPNADILPGTQQFVDKLPLWVCPECRKRVEEDEQKTGLNTLNNDMLFQPLDGVALNSSVSEGIPNKDLCNCHICSGKRHLVPAKTKEFGELQFSWFEVKHFVRCVYRKAGTTLADDDKLTKTSLDIDRMKKHTKKLTSRDSYQLYERLEAQTREYLTEVRVSLIKFFSSSFSNTPQHARDCVMTLLEEYQSLCVAIDILKPFFQKLDSDYLSCFKWSWELMNKELFKEEIFNDSVMRVNLPLLFERLVRGNLTGPLHGIPVLDRTNNPNADVIERFQALTWEMTEADNCWLVAEPLREKYDEEKNLHEREEYENWDECLKETKQEKDGEICGCEQNHLTSPHDAQSSLLSLKRSLSSTSSSSSHSSNQYCSRHAQNSSGDSEDLSNPTQLLPTALFLNRLTNSKCAPCIREALHSFCFDQNTPSTKCQHEEHGLPSSPNSKLSGCNNHSSHDPFWYNHDTPPPETASSIQSLVLNGNSPGGGHCKNHACCTEWDNDDERDDNGYDDDHEGHDGCQEQHKGPFTPNIMIPGNDVDVEAPPSSPSSDRSVGDGSSCDTPTSRSSLSEDGKSNNGKYCDCCYCEFFGHGTPPVAQTSHNFVEIREKLRLRLKERGKKQTSEFTDHPKGLSCIADTRSVDELLTYINGDKKTQDVTQNIPIKSSSKAAKRQRQKQKKAAEKVVSVPEANDKGCLLNKDEIICEKPPFCEEKCKKSNRQRQAGNNKSQEDLTDKENAKNHEKSLTNDLKQNTNAQRYPEDEKPAVEKQRPETGNHLDKRKKGKDKKIPMNKSDAEERRVIVNGQESCSYVEHTRGSRLPVREEAEPKHCGEEAAAQESQTQNQGKKTKNRKKKKGQYLDDVFLPKENLMNGHNVEVDEAEREVEEFKRFCASVAPVTTKLKLPANVNLKNLNLGVKKS